MRRPKVFISHSSKTPESTAFLEQVYAALSQHGDGQSFKVFLDRKIHAGEEWHKEILKELCTCDAVVILLSKAALASHWVRQEAAFSAMRRYGDLALKLVVVTLDDVTAQEIQACPYLGGVARLHDLQFAPKHKTPKDIIDELADVTIRPYYPLGDFLLRMCLTLGCIHSNILEYAIGVLDSNRVATLPWHTSPAHTLALSVVAEPGRELESLRNLLPAIRDTPNRRDIANILLEKVKLLWVKPEAADNLALVQRQEKRVPLIINGFNPQDFTAESYADRAWGKGNHKLVPVGACRSLGEIENILREAIVGKTVPKQFADDRLKTIKQPILLVFPPPESEASEPLLPDEDLLETLISKYPTAAILIPTGKSLPDDRPDLPLLEPKLDVDEEKRQYYAYLEVNEYIESM
ncbi:MAG: hypothetical protein RI964_1543 [Pseudomonadota bacterium]|jgi:hypothetical protein